MADITEEMSKREQIELHLGADDFSMAVNGKQEIPSAKEEDQPLFVIDGEIVPYFKLKTINPNKIDAISIYKGEKAIALYGPENGKNGVVVIKLK